MLLAFLLACGVGACAVPARIAQPPASVHPPEGTDQEPGREEPLEPLPADAAAEAPREIPVGLAAIEGRRQSLAASEYSLEPKSLGYYMDVHEARLRRSFGKAIRLYREGRSFRLVVSGRASFESGSARAREALLPEMRELAAILAEFDKTLVLTHAHTDSTGDADFNMALSERRARNVARLLVEFGVSPDRLVAVGHGERVPVADNDTASGRAQNRRLEITIEPVVRSGDPGSFDQ